MRMSKDKSSRNSIRFIADPYLLFLGISVWLICTTVSGVLSVLLYKGYIPSHNDSDRIFSTMIFLALYILMNFVCLCALPKWLIIISVNKTGISVNQFLKKRMVKQFSDYGYIYFASYRHFGFKIKYIVFSQIKLSDYQLTHINQVSFSEKVIKFRLHNGVTNELKMILPQGYFKQLKKQGMEIKDT